MEALQAITSKRDTRSYKSDPVPEDLLARVLQAGRMAGSAKNSQLTRMIVVTDLETRKRLKGCGDFTTWIDQAPAVIVFAIPFDGGRLFDVGRMAQNVMVAANAIGLATCPVTFHHQDRIRQVLGVPETHEGPMGVTLGYPAPAPPDAPRMRAPRLAIDELVSRDRWS